MSMYYGDAYKRVVRKTHDRTGYPIEYFEPTLTQQQFAEECDINNIVKRNPDILSMGSPDTPMFGDFTSMGRSYHESLNLVLEARAAFDALPSELRARFENNPERLLEFIGNDANYDEAVKLGLVPKPAEPESVPDVSAVPTPPTGG